MNGPLTLVVGLALLAATSCGGVTTAMPTAPSSTSDRTPAPAALPALPAPTHAAPGSLVMKGTVGSVFEGAPPCWADRYPCEVYDFSKTREGPIEVTLAWDGAPRELMVQLYWAGEGLAHEDVAPRNGPSRIWFLRPRMEAANYRLRVVSLVPDRAIPFTLTVTY
jgi:hypothetical protein